MESVEFAVENLENRRLLAGNVTLDLNNGDANIQGDNDGNEVVITAEADGELSIQGVNGTTVNGSSASQEFVVTDDLKINLKNGDNRLIISGSPEGGAIEIADDLDIRTGNGNDAIWVENAIVRDDVSIRTKGGDDAVQVSFGTINDELKINTSGDSDFVRVRAMHVARANIRTGSSDDMLLFQAVSTIEQSKINLGGGSDHGAVGGFFDDDFAVSGGGGSDTYLEVFISNNDPTLKSLELTEVFKESTFLLSSEFTVGVLSDANDFYSAYAS